MLKFNKIDKGQQYYLMRSSVGQLLISHFPHREQKLIRDLFIFVFN